MNKKKKFEAFLESLNNNGNKPIIDVVKKGFQSCFEAGLFGIEPLLPAYGRDYENIEDVQKDFDADKDFSTSFGKLINKAQLVDMGVNKIQVHFNKKEDTGMLTVDPAVKVSDEPKFEGKIINSEIKEEVKLKSGESIPKGEKVQISFISDGMGIEIFSPSLKRKIKMYSKSAHKYFTKFSKPPSMKTMEEWMYDDVAKTVTGHRTEPDGHGPDGSPSWLLVLGLI
jgi:hypothetical protein